MVSLGRLVDSLLAADLPREAGAAARHRHLTLPPEDVRRLAHRRVRRGRLTDYQADVLLSDRPDGPARLALGGYVLLGRLGRGGMGEVFRARHRRTGRGVALKVLSGTAAGRPGSARRFRREVQAAFRVVHPNVVAAFDAGEADGVRYLATDLVDGPDLAGLVAAAGPLPIPTAVGYVVQAARGLGRAHDLGVVHRDVKPSNLLLDPAEVVKVADFGLASLARRDGDSADSDLALPGTTMGTADFISPEQTVDAAHADARSDVYGLGATLWFLLAGRPMYVGRTVVEVILAHRDKPVPSLHAMRGDVPEELDRAFRRMVAKRPQDRFASMAEAAAALEAAAKDVEAGPPRKGDGPCGAGNAPSFGPAACDVLLGTSDADMTFLCGHATAVLPAVPPAAKPTQVQDGVGRPRALAGAAVRLARRAIGAAGFAVAWPTGPAPDGTDSRVLPPKSEAGGEFDVLVG